MKTRNSFENGSPHSSHTSIARSKGLFVHCMESMVSGLRLMGYRTFESLGPLSGAPTRNADERNESRNSCDHREGSVWPTPPPNLISVGTCGAIIRLVEVMRSEGRRSR